MGRSSWHGCWSWACACGLLVAALGCGAEAGRAPGREGDSSVSPPDRVPTSGTGALDDPPIAGSGGSSGGAGVGGASGGSGASGTALPCDVASVVASRCQTCHGVNRLGGAPISLMTVEDFQKDYAVATTTPLLGQTMKVHELARIRINAQMGTTPMPQGGALPATELSALDAWLGAGATSAAAGACAGGGAGTGGIIDMGGMQYDEGPLVAVDGETCYDLPTHGGQTADDTTPYMIENGENYEQYYFDVPWTTTVRATRFGADYDNVAVLHHWLLFTTGLPHEHGSHETVVGTQLGDVDARLLAGWAVGGKNIVLPDDVEFELPEPGTMLNVQWHYYNSKADAQPDASKVQVCTVPPGTRANVGSMTWLGTENFNGPAGMPPGESTWKGTCINETAEPIHIFFFWPHMHQLGTHMSSVVQRAAGTTEQVFDMPFDFNYQVHYDSDVTLMPGDSIVSTCTFNNTTPDGVPFGPSSEQEMCYQFAFSYPAGALDNGVLSLIGATNTCWQFGE